jgi:hypothetical protein
LAIFLTVEYLSVMDTLMYHWFTPAAAGVTLLAVVAVWLPGLKSLRLPARLAGIAAILLIASGTLFAVMALWPGALVYEGNWGLDEVSTAGQFIPVALFVLVSLVPVVAAGGLEDAGAAATAPGR